MVLIVIDIDESTRSDMKTFLMVKVRGSFSEAVAGSAHRTGRKLLQEVLSTSPHWLLSCIRPGSARGCLQ